MRFRFFLALLLVTQSAMAADLRELRLWESPEATRVVFDLSADTRHTVFTLSNPDRVVIDLADLGADTLRRVNQVEGRGLVSKVRSGVQGKGIRVVLEVTQPLVPKTFTLKPSDDQGFRLVVDLPGSVRTAPASAPVPVPVTEPAVTATIAPPTTVVPSLPPAPRSQDKPIIIAIDAGHGGQDPGAIGKTGLQEKEVALAIARKLAKAINAEPNMRAVLTRDGDYRVNVARKHQADLFVSVHANAFHKPTMRGSAVYVLSDRGVTSEHARWLARKENEADLVGGVELHGKDHELAAVLIDLSQSATMEASFDVGSRILRSMGKVNVLQRADVQQAGFMVLKAPDIPSVLVETAFITNEREERLLGQSDYQDKLARSILDGVKGYFQSYRPQQQMVETAPGLQKVSMN